MQEAAGSVFLQYGAVGAIAVLAISALSWFVISQKKDLKESNTKVITLLEVNLKENTDAKVKQSAALSELASAIKGLPCVDGMPCQKWDPLLIESAAKSHAHISGIASGVRRPPG